MDCEKNIVYCSVFRPFISDYSNIEIQAKGLAVDIDGIKEEINGFKVEYDPKAETIKADKEFYLKDNKLTVKRKKMVFKFSR